MSKYLLGIDCGSTMVKAAIVDVQGNELAVAGRKIDVMHPQPGWSENDMTALWEKVCDVIREVLVQSDVPPEEIASVTCTGHGNGLFLVDAGGKPVRPGIGSADGRARQYIEEWTERNVLGTLRAKTMQAIWPAQPNALLRWLRDHEPDTIARAKTLFMCKDYVRFMLTGEAYMEITDMSGTSLIDVGTGRYDDVILEAWGIADLKRIMPPLKKSHDICGAITAEAARRTGLREGTPVAGGMFDIDACGLAVGMVDETRFCIVAGTWGNNQYISKTPVADEGIFMTSRYSIDGYYLMLEGSATSAGNLDWFLKNFFASDAELLAVKSPERNIYAFCEEMIRQTTPQDPGILFLPFLYGNPVDLDAKGTLIGLQSWHTRGDVMRAVFEGIVFGHLWHAKRLFKFRDTPDMIRLTGGGRNSKFWAQMFADVFQIPVEIPTGTELGCLGAAICGAVAVGLYDSYEQACGAMVKTDRTIMPNRELTELYERKYARYLQLLDLLAPGWKSLFFS